MRAVFLFLLLIFSSSLLALPCSTNLEPAKALTTLEKTLCRSCDCALQSFDLSEYQEKRREQIEQGMADIFFNSADQLLKDLALIDFEYLREGRQLLSPGNNTPEDQAVQKYCSLDSIVEAMECQGKEKQAQARRRLKKYFGMETEQDFVESLLKKFNSYQAGLSSAQQNHRQCFSAGDSLQIQALLHGKDSFEELAQNIDFLASPDFLEALKNNEKKGPLSLLNELYDEGFFEVESLLKAAETSSRLKLLLESKEGFEKWRNEIFNQKAKGVQGKELVQVALNSKAIDQIIKRSSAQKCESLFRSAAQLLCGGPSTSVVRNTSFQERHFHFKPSRHAHKFNEQKKENQKSEDQDPVPSLIDFAYSCAPSACTELPSQNQFLCTQHQGEDTPYNPDEILSKLTFGLPEDVYKSRQAYLSSQRKGDFSSTLNKELCPFMICENAHQVIANRGETQCQKKSPLNLEETLKRLNCPQSGYSICSNPALDAVKKFSELNRFFPSQIQESGQRAPSDHGKKGHPQRSSFSQNFAGSIGKLLKKAKTPSERHKVIVFKTPENQQLRMAQSRPVSQQVEPETSNGTSAQKPKKAKVAKSAPAPIVTGESSSLTNASRAPQGNFIKTKSTASQRLPLRGTDSQINAAKETEMKKALAGLRQDFDQRLASYKKAQGQGDQQRLERELLTTQKEITSLERDLARAERDDIKTTYQENIDELKRYRDSLKRLKDQNRPSQAPIAQQNIAPSSSEASISRPPVDLPKDQEEAHPASRLRQGLDRLASSDPGVLEGKLRDNGKTSVVKGVNELAQFDQEDLAHHAIEVKKGEAFVLVVKDKDNRAYAIEFVKASDFSQSGKYTLGKLPPNVPLEVLKKLKGNSYVKSLLTQQAYLKLKRREIRRHQELTQFLDKAIST